MNRLILSLVATSIIAFSSASQALPPGALPQPEFEKKNFLLTNITEEICCGVRSPDLTLSDIGNTVGSGDPTALKTSMI